MFGATIETLPGIRSASVFASERLTSTVLEDATNLGDGLLEAVHRAVKDRESFFAARRDMLLEEAARLLELESLFAQLVGQRENGVKQVLRALGFRFRDGRLLAPTLASTEPDDSDADANESVKEVEGDHVDLHAALSTLAESD